jgi:hypothetical protein
MIIEDCIEVINNVFPDHIYKQLDQECLTLKDIMTIKNQQYMISNYDYKLNWNDVIKPKSIWEKQEHIFKIYSKLGKIYFNFKSPNLYLSVDTNRNNNKNELEDFTAIFFMRQECDKSNGGNLEIYEDERRIISIPYQKNTFVIIKNDKNKKLKYFITDRGICFNSMRYIICR